MEEKKNAKIRQMTSFSIQKQKSYVFALITNNIRLIFGDQSLDVRGAPYVIACTFLFPLIAAIRLPRAWWKSSIDIMRGAAKEDKESQRLGIMALQITLSFLPLTRLPSSAV